MSREELNILREKLINLDDFQSFLIENKIVSSVDLRKRFSTIYSWARKKNFCGDLIYYNQTQTVNERKENLENFLNQFNCLKDFEDYIILNKIRSSTEFQNHKRCLYIKMINMFYGTPVKIRYYQDTEEGEDKNTNTPLLSELYKDKKDFQKYIDDNKITSAKELFLRNKDIYFLMTNLGVSKKVSYFGAKRTKKTYDEKLTSEVQQIIIENKIESRLEFKKKFRKLHDKFCKDCSFDDIVFFGKEPKVTFLTLDDFQNYIINNKIRSLTELDGRLKSLLESYGFLDKINLYTEFNTLEDIQNYVNINEIKTADELIKKHRNVYVRASNLGVFSKIIYYGKFKSAEDVRKKSDKFKTIEDFQKFVDENNIRCLQELKNFDLFIYNKIKRLGFTKYIHFSGVKRSKLEFEVEQLLKDHNIYNILMDEPFPFLKNHKRLDVFLLDFGIGIECQGDQHIIPVDWFGGEENFKKQVCRDKEKYEECISAGIDILYYANPKFMNETERDRILSEIPNYFAPIYTDIKDLWCKISELIKQKQEVNCINK